MPAVIVKRYNGTSWDEYYPKTTHTQIIATGTPSSSTFLRGDGTWATPSAPTHTHDSQDVTWSGSGTALSSGDTIPFFDLSDSRKIKGGITIGSGTTTYLRNDGTWATPPSGTPLALRKTANQTVAGTTLVDSTGMSTSLLGNTSYRIQLIGTFASDITTSGLKVYASYSGTATSCVGQSSTTVNGASSVATSEQLNVISINSNWIYSTGVNTANASNSFVVDAVLRTSTSGTFKIQFAAEAGAGANITMHVGSTLIIATLSE